MDLSQIPILPFDEWIPHSAYTSMPKKHKPQKHVATAEEGKEEAEADLQHNVPLPTVPVAYSAYTSPSLAASAAAAAAAAPASPPPAPAHVTMASPPMTPLHLGLPMPMPPTRYHSGDSSSSPQSTPAGTPPSPSLVPTSASGSAPVTAFSTPITQAINAQQSANHSVSPPSVTAAPAAAATAAPAAAATAASASTATSNGGNGELTNRSILPVILESEMELDVIKTKFTFLFKVEEQRRINASLTTMRNLDRGDKITTKAQAGCIQPEEPTTWYQYLAPEWIRRGLRGDGGKVNSTDVRDLYLEAIAWLDEGIAFQFRLDVSPRDKIFNHLPASQLDLDRKNNRILVVQLLIKIEESLKGFDMLIEKTYQHDKKKGAQNAFSEARDEIKLQLARCRRAVASWSSSSAASS